MELFNSFEMVRESMPLETPFYIILHRCNQLVLPLILPVSARRVYVTILLLFFFVPPFNFHSFDTSGESEPSRRFA